CFVAFAASAARGRPEWPAWVRARGAGRALLAFLRAVMPLRTVHLYGAWPPGIAPPLKFVPVIEGTRDGDEWHAFEYRFVPSTERSRPRVVAPRTPKLDHLVLEEGFPAELDRVLQRLMEPGSPVRRLFGGIPFEAPPSRMRVRLYVLAPAATREPRASGRYWHRDLVGDMLPPRGADPALFDRWLPDPAQSGRDRRSSKGRARRLAPLLDARSLADVQRFV